MLKVRQLSIESGLTGGLRDISLDIERGEILVLIGPNGSGKSLLCQAVADPEIRFKGEIVVNHFHSRREMDKVKTQIGYVAQDNRTEPYLTGFEYLEMIGSFYQLVPKVRQARILDLAQAFHCLDQLYSLGERQNPSTRQKIKLIASLLANPPLLVWDEPAQYLDEFGRQALVAELDKNTKAGASALIATNDLGLAESIADRIIILNHGQLVTEGTPAQLESLVGTHKKSLSESFRHLLANG